MPPDNKSPLNWPDSSVLPDDWENNQDDELAKKEKKVAFGGKYGTDDLRGALFIFQEYICFIIFLWIIIVPFGVYYNSTLDRIGHAWVWIWADDE